MLCLFILINGWQYINLLTYLLSNEATPVSFFNVFYECIPIGYYFHTGLLD